MTKILPSFSVLFFLANQILGQAVEADTLPTTKMVWDAVFYNFGKVKEGAVVEHAYRFTNAGTAPLAISFVTAACGCTVPEWPKDTIAPSGTGEIKVRFNTTRKSGQQLKVIRVLANTDPAETMLQLSGDVKMSKRKRRHKG